MEVVSVLFKPLPHFEEVTEALCGDEPYPGALSLDQGVRSDGRAVNESVGEPKQLRQRNVIGIGHILKSGHQADGGVMWRGSGLEESRTLAVFDYDKVRERPSDVDPYLVHLSSRNPRVVCPNDYRACRPRENRSHSTGSLNICPDASGLSGSQHRITFRLSEMSSALGGCVGEAGHCGPTLISEASVESDRKSWLRGAAQHWR